MEMEFRSTELMNERFTRGDECGGDGDWGVNGCRTRAKAGIFNVGCTDRCNDPNELVALFGVGVMSVRVLEYSFHYKEEEAHRV
jgi:hypothetical protein